MIPQNEILELIDAYLDGDIMPTAIERLRVWLSESETNVEFFAQQVFLHQQLRETLIAENAVTCLAAPEVGGLSSSASVDVIETSAKPSSYSFLGGDFHSLLPGFNSDALKTLFLVVLAALAGGLVTYHFTRGDRQLARSVAAVSPNVVEDATEGDLRSYVARLVNTTNCRWDRTSSTADLRPGGTLRPGESLRLLEGVAEINVVSPEGGETRIQLEGPLAMVLTNNGMPSLFYGKLSAMLTGSHDQYMIDTLLGRINVVGDAAIGVMAGNKEIELHVFAGQVTFDSLRPLRGESNAYRWSIGAGDSIRLTDSTVGDILVKRAQADERSFANPSSIAARQLLVSEAYVAKIREASPIAYWRFEEMTDGIVRNEMGDRLYCRIMGNGVRLHSYDGNRSVELGMAAESGYLLSDDLLEGIDGNSYTIEAWVKPSCYHLGVVFRLYDGIAIDRPNCVHLELTGPITGPVDQPMPPWTKYPGRFRFMHAGESCYSEQPYRLSEWQHLAAAKDGSKMRLYINGKLISEGESAAKFDCGFPILIGQLQPKPQGFGYPARRFIGELDEIALYDRALSEHEIESRVAMVEMAGTRHSLLAPEELLNSGKGAEAPTATIDGSKPTDG